MTGREALKSAVVFLTGACVMALLLHVSARAAEALRNGGFESGDLAGWTAGGPPGSSVTVVSSFFHEREHRPMEGGKFALLKSPPQSIPRTTLIQKFRAEAGAVISGWSIFFTSGTIPAFYGDLRYEVNIRSSEGREQRVFYDDNKSSVFTPWIEWKYTLPVDGEYMLVAIVHSTPYGQQDTYLGLDGITVTAPADTKAPVVTPPKDIRVEIPAREKSAPASHPDIATFLSAATANDDRDGAVTAKAVNPPASFPVGDTTVTFEAVDAAGNRGTATARVTVVQAPNRPPQAMDDGIATRAGTAAEVNVAANDSDPDGDALAAELVKPPAHGRATLAPDGTLRYTPEAGFTGDDVLTYVVHDGQGGRAEAMVRIVIADTPAKTEAPKPADAPPVTPPPPVEPAPPVTPTATVVKAPDGSVTWTFRGEIVEHKVNYHAFPANKDWLYVFEIGDGKNQAQWIRVDPGGTHAPREDTSYADKTRRRFAWVPPETKDYRVQVWAAKGPYVLTVTGRADDHGNDWQHATPVALGQTVPGEIWEVPGNVDVFSFQGKKGAVYRIETQQPENPKGVLRVYDRQRGGATREDFTWAGKPSRNVTFRTPRDDTYYVQVWGGVGKYSLRITQLK